MAVFFSVSESFSQPCSSATPLNSNVSVVHATCTAGGSATVNVTNGTAPITYTWMPNVSSTNTASGLTPGTYTVEINDTGCHATGPELVTNGDFSLGNTGFSSSYSNCSQCCNTCLWPDASYAVGNNPQWYHSVFYGTDHTTGSGNMMIINGASTPNVSVWCQTINVTPNTNYVFSTWVAAMNTISSAQLQFSINGTSIGNIFSSPAQTYLWDNFCTSWNSGSNTTANICIINQSTVIYGNDFALDDISFKACTPAIATFTISQFPAITINANFSGTQCLVGSGIASVSVIGGTPSYTYQWSNGQTTSSITGLTTGNYSVTVTDATGCTASATVSITSSTNPPTAAINTSPVCLGSPSQLLDASISPSGDPIIGWNWNLPNANPSTSYNQNPSVIFTTAGTHTVSLIVTTLYGCSDTITQQVLVYNPPQANFSGGQNGCAPVCAQFSDLSQAANGTISSWQWSFPGGNPAISLQQNPGTICYNTPGSYGASLIVTDSYGCSNAIVISPLVNAYSSPNADFCISQNEMPAENPVFNFCNLWSQDVSQWYWDFGDNSQLDSSSTDPVHSYSASVSGNQQYSFTVTLYVQNQYGCWDTITKTVEIIPEFTFYIPNSFTPNGDHDNEFFFGKGKGIKDYSIYLFDRWGNLIWDCSYTGENNSWDSGSNEGMPSACKWNGIVTNKGSDFNGKSKQLVQEDMYVWKVELTDVFNKEHKYMGHVSVIR